MKKKLLIIAKIVVSAGLLWLFLLLNNVLVEIVSILRSTNFLLLGLAFSLHLSGLWLSAWRWQMILDKYNCSYSLLKLAGFYLVGNFFSHFLPSRYGGDLVRGTLTKTKTEGMQRSFAAIVYERGSGIFILLLFALGAALLRIKFVLKFPAIAVFLLLTLIFLLMIIGFILFRLEIRLQPFASRLKRGEKLFRKGLEFIAVLRQLFSDRVVLKKIMLGGILLQVNVVLHYFLISRALGLKAIPAFDFFIIIPLLTFLMSLPISINGIGVRDWSLLLLFQPYGYSAVHALAFSFIDLFFNLVLGMVGGIIFLTIRREQQ